MENRKGLTTILPVLTLALMSVAVGGYSYAANNSHNVQGNIAAACDPRFCCLIDGHWVACVVTRTVTVTQGNTTTVTTTSAQGAPFNDLSYIGPQGQSLVLTTSLHPQGKCYTSAEESALASLVYMAPNGTQIPVFPHISGNPDSQCYGVPLPQP